MKIRRPFELTWPVALLTASVGSVTMLLLVISFASFRDVATTFNVTIETERVDFTRTVMSPARWAVDDVEFVHGNQEHGVQRTGTVEFGAAVRGFVQRVALGPIWVHLECPRPDDCRTTAHESLPWCGPETHVAGNAARPSVGRFFLDDDKPCLLDSPVDAFIGDPGERAARGRTFVFPLAGNVTAGRPVGMETPDVTAILRQGTIALLDKPLIGAGLFESRRHELSLGDQFNVEDSNSGAYGFVLADERPALTAAYRIAGHRGTVVRPGGGTIILSASLLDRLREDPNLGAIAALLGLIGTFSSVVALTLPLLHRPKESSGTASTAPAPLPTAHVVADAMPPDRSAPV